MIRIRLSPLLFRRIHKWVGLVLGLQFVLWTLSGAMMALLDSDKVGGHDSGTTHVHPLAATHYVDPVRVAGSRPLTGLTLRHLAGRPVYELIGVGDTQLIDARLGTPITIDRATAVAVVAMLSSAPVTSAERLEKPNLESREHTGPIWRVNLSDAENSSAYVSAVTGRHLVTRGDTWRTWDFFWMLHNMDYVNRKSFNHPLIVFVAFGILWLSGTGFYLLFKSFRKSDFRWLRMRRR